MQAIDKYLSENYYNGDLDAEEIIAGLRGLITSATDRETLLNMYNCGEELEEIVASARFMH